MQDQQPYWNQAASEKTFTHPLNWVWLEELVSKKARILDYGCGYGRVIGELLAHGYVNLVGMDFSPAMMDRARQAYPFLDLRVVEFLPTCEGTGSFDAILLFAVLTSIPDEAQQDAVMYEMRRLLRPGGVLFISDMPLQQDGRNVSRYDRDLPEFSHYGIFRTDDGAVMRHHDNRRMRAWMDGFELLKVTKINLPTMNGNPAIATQVAARRLA